VKIPVHSWFNLFRRERGKSGGGDDRDTLECWDEETVAASAGRVPAGRLYRIVDDRHEASGGFRGGFLHDQIAKQVGCLFNFLADCMPGLASQGRCIQLGRVGLRRIPRPMLHLLPRAPPFRPQAAEVPLLSRLRPRSQSVARKRRSPS
jgi:hypothetical protein